MYEYPFWSPLYLTLTAFYFLVASVVTFDIRLNQARKMGEDYGTLPSWVALFYWFQWILWVSLAVLNWKLALALFVVKFILKVIPILETIGNFLMFPFKPKEPISEFSPETKQIFARLDKEQAWRKTFDELDEMENHEVRFSRDGEITVHEAFLENQQSVEELDRDPDTEEDLTFISVIRDDDYDKLPPELVQEVLDKFGHLDDGSQPTVRGLDFSKRKDNETLADSFACSISRYLFEECVERK